MRYAVALLLLLLSPVTFGRFLFVVGLASVAALTSAPAAVASGSTIWSSSATPHGVDSDASAVEIGVRFRSDTNGVITGLRFYKYSSNTGAHVGNLWTNTGTLLAVATFVGETGSGWQQVTFATPVAITANTTYVASYHTNVGHYGANSGYFASGVDNAPLHALQDGVGGSNGVYRYGATSGFPNQSYLSTNYWVDVVFAASVGGGDTSPPTVNGVTPAIAATGVSTTSAVTATFSEMMDSTTLNATTVELRDSTGNVVPASVLPGGETPTTTLSPSAPLAFGTTYTALIKGGSSGVQDLAGNAMAADYSWSFTTGGTAPSPPPTSCPCTIWNTTTTAPSGADTDVSALEIGVRFRSDSTGFITGLRFYKNSTNSGVHVGNLWTNTGTKLATATFTSETSSGWQQVSFTSPVAITADTTYVASYHTNVGHYAANDGYFASGFDNAPLHALQDGVDGSSGVYHYGASSVFPDQTYHSANYWVDVVFNTTPGADTTAPTINSVAPAIGATGVSTTSVVTTTFSEMMSSTAVNQTTFQLRDSAGNVVPAAVMAGGGTPTATLTPTLALAYATTYTATVQGGASGVKDMSGNAMAVDYTWSFTTAAPPAPLACPCTVWSASAIPAVADTDPSAVELGVRFRSDVAGYITGLRYYKASANGGIHVGNLWSNSGVLLAWATFVNESAAGWQQVTLTPPVAIAANTTYVVSYHTNTGHYGVNSNYFASGFDNAPLHALRDGLDGPNGVYAYDGNSSFPDQTYQSANYWVDVVFNTTPGSDTTAPTVNSVTPLEGATAVEVTRVITATFSEMMATSSFNTITFELRDAAGVIVPASVLVGGETPTVTLTPTSPLAYATTYTAAVKKAVTDLAGNAMTADYAWPFTTSPVPGTCPCSIWNDAATPAGPDSDTGSVEVGVKFQSAVAGYITALRFYKFPANAGTHVGELWTRYGTRLAVVTFTNETSSGWQQVTLPSAIAIAADTTYIASYHTDVGHYAVNSQYFASGVINTPLRALSDGEDGGNGVYEYGPSGSYPAQTYQSENYWVDVVFGTVAPDTTVPIVTSVTPGPGAQGVSKGANITATFSEAMNAGTIDTTTFELHETSGVLAPAVVTYDPPTRTATLDPTGVLGYSMTYTAILKGGASDPRAKDLGGNALAINATWNFTTGVAPSPTPNDGPGGPILVVSSTGNPFSRYYAEILRAEGLNAFAVADLSGVSAATLSVYDVVILGEMPLTAAQVTMFSDWVNGGGNLIAMRPDQKLSALLGVAALSSTLSEGYVLVDGSTQPGAGIVSQAIQFHGTADVYALSGATSVAELYASPLAETPNPAVTLNTVGGGHAAAFTYDLARSIVYTRQGNPAWAGQERDGVVPISPDDLFFGASSTDFQPDWVNLDKIAIPQADEQQRLLVNLIEHMNLGREPLPRFWYFPRGVKAVVVMTSEDHGTGRTAARFDEFAAASPVGCSVANWECVRATSYISSTAPIANAAATAYTTSGFEIGLQVSTNCGNWTTASLQTSYTDQLNAFAASFPGVPAPTTHRALCSAWSDYATQPQTELVHGIRLDTSYSHGPDVWVTNGPGFFTGSGVPMRFVDTTGALIDVYQAAAQMTDDSGQSYPFTVDALLDKALGSDGYYGAFTANIDADAVTSPDADQIVAEATSRGVPIVSARQMLDWLDGRNGSSFQSLTWNGTMESFSVAVGAGANGLQAMLPTTAAAGTLATITVNGNPVAFTRQTIKGVEYALFQVAAGTYQAIYTP